MKEIEVKAYLRDGEQVIENLKNLGCVLSSPVKQIDTVYTKLPALNVEEYLKNDHFVRIRETSDDRFIFTVKKPLSKTSLTKAEHETEIENAKEMEAALSLMGYKIANKVIKNRQTVEYKEYEICIDEVEEMGIFIEVERMSEEDPESVLKELKEFLIKIGVSMEDEVRRGYDIIAVEQQIK